MNKNPRRLALLILEQLRNGRQTLDGNMEAFNSRYSQLAHRDRRLVYALVYGVLRWRAYLDWMTARFSRTPLHRIQAPVLDVLRLGLFQIIFLERIPPSAAVDTSVDLAKAIAPQWVARFVNGLLRNVVRSRDRLPRPASHRDPVSVLSIEKSFPPWLVRRWYRRFGREQTVALLDALNTIAPLTLKANTLRISRDDLTLQLHHYAEHLTPTAWAPDGIELRGLKRNLFESEAFQEGLFHIQDEAAQLVALLLDAQPGHTILDACAGRGGKSVHAAQYMNNHGRILALDHHAGKLDQLVTESRRLGFTIIMPVQMDLNRPAALNPSVCFDRILLDAPCSGLGVIRRNPDAKWNCQPGELKALARRQLCFLEDLCGFLAPNGVLVYTVCSFEPEENEQVVDAFLKKHSEFAIAGYPSGFPAVAAKAASTPRGCFQTLPHRHGMDGFFAAAFKRKPPVRGRAHPAY
jgi:16S rRNA (cytosine967-C5)-methyltransferase